MIKLNLNMYRQVSRQTLHIPYRTEAALSERLEIFKVVKNKDAEDAMYEHLKQLKQYIFNGGEIFGNY
ncbi:MAG: hypothetical protein ABS949_06815 [Solibacillus sp.]